jgi:hypothetical protein
MNAFLDYAEKQTPAAVKARQRAAEKRRATAAEKALAKAAAEREDLFFLWRRWRKERLDALLAGPHAAAASELVTFLNAMTLEDGARLIEFVRAADWARADADTKFEILSLINAAITALRERAELPPFSDPLPGEEPTAFLILREMFR